MAQSSSQSSPSDAELEDRLDLMLTRLALCDDVKLQSLLAKLLPFTISALSSPSITVRNKVLEILNHINKRVKHQPEIGLPLSELWTIYSDTNSNGMVKNFCILYIEMAMERAPLEEKKNMAPIVLHNSSKFPNQHQEVLLRLVMKVIGECHANGIVDDVAEQYKLVNTSKDRDLFLEFCLHTILYQPPSESNGCAPGLSINLSNRIDGKKPLKQDALLSRKLGILNVVEAMELPSEIVYPIYMAASSDCQELVVKRGEDLLKKKASNANLDDPDLIKRLLSLFIGTTSNQDVASDLKVKPGSITLRAKLMSIFCRSITAANSFPSTLQCIFGCMYGADTTLRLKQLGMEFTVWVFKHAKTEQLKLMGPFILNGIIKLLDGNSNSDTDTIKRDTRNFAFQAIGLLAKRMPQLFRDKVDMAVRLFEALKLESPSYRLVIQEATNSLAIAYKGAPATVLQTLETILLDNCQMEQSEVRFCAVRWATSLFDWKHCPSRFICMLGAADSKLDIREMALDGLFLRQDEAENADVQYPKLRDMLDFIVKQQPKLLDPTDHRDLNLLFPSKTYVVMIKFLLRCFEEELREKSFSKVAPEFLSSVGTLSLLLEHAMAFEGSIELHGDATKALIVVASNLPEMIASRLGTRITFLKQLLGHVDFNTRESTARLLGIASSALSASEISDLQRELLSSVSGIPNLRFETQHGVLCAIGYVTAESLSKNLGCPETFQKIIKFLRDVISTETPILASVALQALGHIGLRVPLPAVDNDSDSVPILVSLRDRLSKLLSGDDIKAIQNIVIALGHICVMETSSVQLDVALDLTFGLCRSKVEDVLFAAGEALSFMWGGVPVTPDEILRTNYTSLSMSSKFLTRDVSSSLSRCEVDQETKNDVQIHVAVRNSISRKLFDELLYSSRKEERCAGTVWLLSLTMYCGQHPSIQRLLPEIQEVFSHLLGEQNELTQELASQGMSIVYELGDEEMKKNLVNALVSTLTGAGKRKRAIKLVEDSEVFQEGALGQNPGGGKLSTYKELCSLANEMGQPDMIYKFMDLANHQASLNSKRGAAFGFSKIAKQAGDALQPHMRSLVPRLLRYQYDPDKNVQDAMAHIWKSLVADSKKTIDEYFDIIIEDLIVQSGSRLWRSREASCLALADNIQGRRFDQVGKHLKNIWTAAFRAMDDIKETVRKSGDSLCRSVTTLTIRLCDVTLTEASDASKTMDTVLPLLLAEGILSKVDSIRKASIGIVMKLAKGAGVAIRPHLPELVCCMLESLSSLEDQGLNYVEMHAENAGIKTDMLENLRISVAKGSPMWETLDICIRVVDTESLDLLVPRLAQLVRSGVGLNTRVGVASFISSLLQKVGPDIKPFSSTLLRLLFPAVKEEKSIAAKRAFASACGLVLKYAPQSQGQKLIEDTAALHNGDRNAQIACAILLMSYLSRATDIMSGYYAIIMPVIFISRFDDDKYVSGLFEELWENSTSGERITLKLYLEETVALICEGIKSSSWASKKKSALATKKLSDILKDSLSSHHHILLECLMKELPGRLWEGKDALLDAVGALSSSGHEDIYANDPTAPITILNSIMSACRKKVKKYRESAFSCLEQVIKAFGNPDFFNLVFPLLYEMSNLAAAPKPALAIDATDKEPNEVESSTAPIEKVLNCLASCIQVGHLNDIMEQKEGLINIFVTSLSPGSSWNVKVAAFTCVKELCARLDVMDDSDGNSKAATSVDILIHQLFDSISPRVVECLSIVKIAQVHIAASECLLDVTKLYCHSPPSDNKEIEFRKDLVHQLELEKNEQAKGLLKKSLDMVDNLSLPSSP
uniref:Proteasome-associated protein ECM29 homolog n=1 Tax=Kalanchoe fedtschenkoi TaxID=63787 RepID=A0A7N0UGU9_KALFE